MTVREHWHAGITVSDLDRSIEFYGNVLGLRERVRQVQDNAYTRTMLGYDDCVIRVAQLESPDATGSISGHLIELVQFDDPLAIVDDGPMHRLGTVHVSLTVDTLDGVHDKIVENGGSPMSEPLEITAGVNAGGRVMWFRDPDHVLVELVQPPERLL